MRHYGPKLKLQLRATPFAVGAAVIVLAACGGSSNTSSSSSSAASPSPSPTKAAQIASVDACKLVTQADASTAVGANVTNLAAANGGAVQLPGLCYYGSSDGSASVVVYAQVYPDTSAAQNVSPEQIAASINASAGNVMNAKPVSGIGDKAVEYTTGSANNAGYAIFIFKSNAIILIAVTPLTDPSVIENLGKTAVSRL